MKRINQNLRQKKNSTFYFLFPKFFVVFLFSIFYFLLSVSSAQAATLYFSPSSGAYTVGGTFSVNVYVSSADQAINAASGMISFPPAQLEVLSLSKSGSVFTLWVQEPSFLNSAGTINFEGIVLNPGFTGATGKILTANFKVKTAGASLLNFSSGSVLANDGKGTNILASMGTVAYTLVAKIITPLPPGETPTAPTTPTTPTTPTLPTQEPVAPVISSSTHPDENKWYSNNNPEFTWKLPSDVSGVSLILNKLEIANPGNVSDGLMESKKIEDVEDALWYFHIKFRNQQGWGKITHRKVLIDTMPPLSFEIQVQRENSTDPQPILLFETTDELSRIEYYELRINDGELFSVRSGYKLPLQAPGEHLIEVKAFDKAGNFTSAKTEIEVLPIETPKITEFPESLTPGQNLTLEGETIAEAAIKIFVQKKGAKLIINEVKANKEGEWSFVSAEGLAKGDYEFWVEAKDERGALSLPSEEISLEVGLPPFLEFGTMAISYLMIMATLILLIAVLVLIIFYIWYRISIWRKRISKETKEVAQSVTAAFRALREEVQEQIEYLDKKPGLTKEEKAIRDKLQEALDVSEQFISKELKDVEKELE